jgi:hypothetical protein
VHAELGRDGARLGVREKTASQVTYVCQSDRPNGANPERDTPIGDRAKGGASAQDVFSRYGHRARGRRSIWWGNGRVAAFVLSRTRAHPFGLGWMRPPSFMVTPLESPVHIDRCTPGSVRGTQKRTR